MSVGGLIDIDHAKSVRQSWLTPPPSQEGVADMLRTMMIIRAISKFCKKMIEYDFGAQRFWT